MVAGVEQAGLSWVLPKMIINWNFQAQSPGFKDYGEEIKESEQLFLGGQKYELVGVKCQEDSEKDSK